MIILRIAMTKEKRVSPYLILPEGTQVVTLVAARDQGSSKERTAGAVGVIVKSPTDNDHAYVIQYPDGGRASLLRKQIAIRKQVQNVSFENPDAALLDRELKDHIIYSCIVGSRAYGLDHEESDLDRRGIYLPPAELHWSLYGVPEQIEETGGTTDEVYFELQKFLVLSLKANPSVLECLYTPLVEIKSELARELLESRNKLLSQLVYQTFNGYVLSQFKKLESDINQYGEPKWKHVMHLIRLLLSGITTLQEGVMPVEVNDFKKELLQIRRGEMPFDEVNQWRLELHKQFDSAFEKTKLPERPDYVFADSYLRKARRSMV